jgi:molybdenum cofactor biosynthesis enzyme MoaA
MMDIEKNRNRGNYTFANINLLGKCNANCYFCLGKDIPELLNKHNQEKVHWSKWNNFDKFLDRCKVEGIKKLYLTGQNTDALCYKYFDEFVDYIQSSGFVLGIRTNGYLLKDHVNAVRKLQDEVGLSAHSLNPETNYKIMKRRDILDWKSIIPSVKSKTNTIRVATVVNRYNADEFESVMKYLSEIDEIKYIQARRISTDIRKDELMPDIEIYENVYQKMISKHKIYGDFYGAQLVNMFGKEVCFWRTVETSANSLNYFTDGTCSDNYFVVEGYLKNYKKEDNK